MLLRYCDFNPAPFEAHMQVFKLINEGEKVLDIGCATGYFAEKLNEKKCKVVGIEMEPSAAKLAERFCQKVFIGDAMKISSFSIQKNYFDVILMLDVLEHFKDPEAILLSVKNYLKREGRLIISTPNVAHISVRVKIMAGKFDYQESGILDKSHLHFFTKKNLIKIIKEAGLGISEINYSADFGQIPVFGRILRRIPKKIQYRLTKLFSNLLAVQFIVICQRPSKR